MNRSLASSLRVIPSGLRQELVKVTLTSMAGFVVFIGAPNPAEAQRRLISVISSGVYGAILRPPSGNRWWESQEGTFADYATATAGDSVFFFCRRKLYGIGSLCKVKFDCKFVNFVDGSLPKNHAYDSKTRSSMLLDMGANSVYIRWICTFEPAPAMFLRGVDMDDALSSRPAAFRALRAMDNVTFGRVDDEEEQALRDVVLRANEDVVATGISASDRFPDNHVASHAHVAANVTSAHRLRVAPLLLACAQTSGRLSHEMALEAGLVAQLAEHDSHTVATFEAWDYLSHQVLASPFKPLKWADRMDVFGYRYMSGFRPTIARYLVGELKKDEAGSEEVGQVLKYVDWVRDEYSRGDYSPIRAFLVAAAFSKAAIAAAEQGVRTYTIGRRPAVTRPWNDLSLVEYTFNPTAGRLRFKVASPGIR
jgi:hypothetical protein